MVLRQGVRGCGVEAAIKQMSPPYSCPPVLLHSSALLFGSRVPQVKLLDEALVVLWSGPHSRGHDSEDWGQGSDVMVMVMVTAVL